MPRGMPGARIGGSGSDGSNSGRSSGDTSGAVTVWEVVSLLGKLLGTVAALKVVLYLLRVCFAMAWKSGGASHSELIHNLRSKCHPRPAWAREQGRAWTLSPPDNPERSVCTPAPAGGRRSAVAPGVRNAVRFCSLLSRDLSLGDVDGKRVVAKRELLRVGHGQLPPRRLRGTGCGTGGGAVAGVCGPTSEGRDFRVGKCRLVSGDWTSTEGTPPSAYGFSHCSRLIPCKLSVFCLPRPLFFPLEGDAAV